MNNQILSALIHSFVVTILLVTFSWLGLTDFAWQPLPDKIETLHVEKVSHDELPMELQFEIQQLKQAQRIESKFIGSSAHRSEVFQAYQTILAEKRAEQIFKYLLNDKNIVTKVYAMKGLQVLQSPLVPEIKPYFSNSQLYIHQISGCIGHTTPVSEIIKTNLGWEKIVLN